MSGEPHPSRETFDAAEYPEGYRCASCQTLFADGEMVARHFQGALWTYLKCLQCSDRQAPLCADHPLREEGSTLLAVDGSVKEVHRRVG